MTGRTAFAQTFLANMKAFADAYNLVNGTLSDNISKQIAQINSLAQTFGFQGVPTMEEFQAKLKDMLTNATIDPTTVANMVAFHDALINVKFALVQAIGSLVQFIDTLNTKIVGLGGSALDVSGSLTTAIGDIQNTINQGGLSLDQRDQALQLMSGLVDQFVAEQVAAMQKVNQAQQAAIQSTITALNAEKTQIQTTYQARLTALNSELAIAQKWVTLTDQVKASLDKILLSPQAPLTGIEQLNRLQSEIGTAKGALTHATTPEAKQAAISTLKDLQDQLFQVASSALPSASPAFQAIFQQVTKELQALLKITDAGAKDVAAIQASIDKTTKEMNDKLAKIDSSIAGLNKQLSTLQAQSNQIQGAAAAQAKQYYEFIRTEAMKDLQIRISQLATMIPIDVQQLSIQTQQLATLTDISTTLKKVTGFQEGGFIPPGSNKLAVLHGGSMGEYVIPGHRLPSAIGMPQNASPMNLSFSFDFRDTRTNGNRRQLETDVRAIVEDEVIRGSLGKRIQERVRGR